MDDTANAHDYDYEDYYDVSEEAMYQQAALLRHTSSFPTSSSFSYAIAIDFGQFLPSRAASASVSMTEPQQQQQHRQYVAAALLEWWISYHATILIRRTPAVVKITGTTSNDSVLVLHAKFPEDDHVDFADETRTTTTKIEDTIRASVKKIEVEDLGDMNASDLRTSMTNSTTTITKPPPNSMVLVGSSASSSVELPSTTQSFKDTHNHNPNTNTPKTRVPQQKQHQPQQQPLHGIHDLHTLEQQLRVKVVFNTTNGHVYLVGEAKKLAKKVYPIRNILRHYHWRLSGQES